MCVCTYTNTYTHIPYYNYIYSLYKEGWVGLESREAGRRGEICHHAQILLHLLALVHFYKTIFLISSINPLYSEQNIQLPLLWLLKFLCARQNKYTSTMDTLSQWIKSVSSVVLTSDRCKQDQHAIYVASATEVTKQAIFDQFSIFPLFVTDLTFFKIWFSTRWAYHKAFCTN